MTETPAAAESILGPITPFRCTEPGCHWACHGVPDKYTDSRAQILADHITSEHTPRPVAKPAPATTLPAALDRAADLHQSYDGACGTCADDDGQAAVWPCETAVALAVARQVLGTTTGQGEPCDPISDTCRPEAGDLCADHQRKQAHAEGEHAFCGDKCTTTRQPEGESAETQPHGEQSPLDEARMWARHGYELGQRSCTWSDHGVAPAWLTEGWPTHLPSDLVPNEEQPVQPDRAALRDRIRRAVCEAEGFAWDTDMLEPDEYGEVADAVMAVLPTGANLPAVLREAADDLTALAAPDSERGAGVRWAADHLRHKADQVDTGGDDEVDDTLHACPGRWAGPDCRCFDADTVEQPEPESHRPAPAVTEEPTPCGNTQGLGTTNPYRPCARPAGHPEAYCKDATGDHLFLPATHATEEPTR
ncbi:hypothetical protein PV334_20070 [Streptomyces sp. ME02-7008A-1]|uniref:hypothetical protein n=1 Tax=unclassified Streptomyces TaxID=2593676 RepID=UPI0029AC49E1|nr:MULTISPECIES: hypothetical protein [unclassified Streptomyces]MDX3183546.1 hypothetical protein [Streptomyces sp. ME02-7008A-1]MDX3303998.1 hypothetical protein [Streptomyces sp. ME02-7008A]